MKNKIWLLIVFALVVFGVGLTWRKITAGSKAAETVKIVSPYREDIKIIISSTGTVLPKNRLEIKPPVNGRIEQVLVEEGQKIKAGDILIWMSSTDRAALLDAARGRGEAAVKEWQDVYKPIPLMSPIDGEVIVGTIQPGQTVTAEDDVLVLSDRLIVRAQVDETDIGKIQKGQNAEVTLDAYSDTKIEGVVNHIYYESKTVNNVTIYDVDLLLERVPPFFRSGMNANIDFVTQSKKNVLVLPLAVVHKSKEGSWVMIRPGGGHEKSMRRDVTTGISDEKNIEILSGVTENDAVLWITKKYSLPQNGGTNPFMPARRSSGR